MAGRQCREWKFCKGLLANCEVEVILRDYLVGLMVVTFNDQFHELRLTAALRAAVSGEIYCCGVAPDGTTIVAGNHSGRVHFLDLRFAGESGVGGSQV